MWRVAHGLKPVRFCWRSNSESRSRNVLTNFWMQFLERWARPKERLCRDISFLDENFNSRDMSSTWIWHPTVCCRDDAAAVQLLTVTPKAHRGYPPTHVHGGQGRVYYRRQTYVWVVACRSDGRTGARLVSVHLWTIKCQLLTSNTFFPMADGVYCTACSSLYCCLICS